MSHPHRSTPATRRRRPSRRGGVPPWRRRARRHRGRAVHRRRGPAGTRRALMRVRDDRRRVGQLGGARASARHRAPAGGRARHRSCPSSRRCSSWSASATRGRSSGGHDGCRDGARARQARRWTATEASGDPVEELARFVSLLGTDV